MSDGNGTAPRIAAGDDFDAILAERIPPIRLGGRTFDIVPINAATQRVVREIQKQIEAKELALTAGEITALIARRCLRPVPEQEWVDEQATVALEQVVERASRGIMAVERIAREMAGREKNADAAPEHPAPPTGP